jgi:hypothetical protein
MQPTMGSMFAHASVFVPLLVAVAISAQACTDDRDAPEFTYTPLPTVVHPSGTAVTQLEGADPFVADELRVHIEERHESALVELFGENGFVVVTRDEIGAERLRLLLRVPPGSVLDAATYLSDREGVVSAAPNYLFEPD